MEQSNVHGKASDRVARSSRDTARVRFLFSLAFPFSHFRSPSALGIAPIHNRHLSTVTSVLCLFCLFFITFLEVFREFTCFFLFLMTFRDTFLTPVGAHHHFVMVVVTATIKTHTRPRLQREITASVFIIILL